MRTLLLLMVLALPGPSCKRCVECRTRDWVTRGEVYSKTRWYCNGYDASEVRERILDTLHHDGSYEVTCKKVE
jgi:hypothetical protein